MKTVNGKKVMLASIDRIRKLEKVLTLGIVILAWPHTLRSAVGNGPYSAELAAFSLVDPNQQGTQSLQDLLQNLHKENAQDRQRAAIALGNSKDPGAVEPLIKSLQDDDDFVRSFAARALGNIGDARALNSLIKALGDKHVLVRCSAAQALGNLKDPKAIDPLIGVLEGGDVLVQRSAAKALGEIRDPRAIDPLVKLLQSDDIYLQTGAANALAVIGEAAIPKLVAELGQPKMGPRVAEILKELHWQPPSEQDKSRYEAALKNE